MKYLRYFEAFEIKSIPYEETQFKALVKKLMPHNFNRYYTLYKNIGLKVAKEQLLKDAEQITALQAEVKKMNRYEQRARQNLFNVTPDDLNYYKPTKKDTKQFICGLLTNNLKKIYQKYGFWSLNGHDTDNQTNNLILNSDDYKHISRTGKYDTSTDTNFYLRKTISFSLGNLVDILDGSANFFGIKYDNNVAREAPNCIDELNETKISGYYIYSEFDINFEQKFTPFWSKMLNTKLYFKLGYGISTYNEKDYTLISIHMDDNMNGKFVSMFDEKANELHNSIKNRTTKAFITLGNKIRNEQPKADIKYKEFINNILTSCVELLNNNSARYYRNVNLIKENYPIAWEILKTKINDEEGLNKASEMGDMGFSD